jgi:hypothetical protein
MQEAHIMDTALIEMGHRGLGYSLPAAARGSRVQSPLRYQGESVLGQQRPAARRRLDQRRISAAC